MQVFEDIQSVIPKPKTWSDDLHFYVLLSQAEHICKQGNDEEIPGFLQSYAQYTHAEWQEHITQSLQKDAVSQLDQSLEGIRTNKINETKTALERYYKENPLFSTVHKKKGEYYSITSAKQSYLLSMIFLAENAARDENSTFKPMWNATGEPYEEWKIDELKQLSLQIAEFVYPVVNQQQEYEKKIKTMENIDDIKALEITYGVK